MALAGLALLAVAVPVIGRMVYALTTHNVGALQLLDLLVIVTVVMIGVTITVRSRQSDAGKVMFGIATVLVAIAITAAGDTLGRFIFGGRSLFEGGPSASEQTSAQAAPPGSTTPGSGYTWAQLDHDYPGLRTPCIKQPNAAGKLQCYWSHYSNVGLVEPAAEKLPEGPVRDELLADFEFYRKEYPQVQDCTTTTLTTNFGCIAGAQMLDSYDSEIASSIQQGLSGGH
ncbi:hypothetical protein [Mycobacterium interjectum]|uniref:hypothetical protein n=2 Tax=Mycobacterium interjectum TaxID=33895 RepID=UPI0008347A56|nr:hypothetical protein [Mycobacterium interjectum]